MYSVNMKVPDKLYIGRRNYGPLIGGWKSQPFTSKQIESIEYIRKDTLLEWAKECFRLQDKGSWYSKGAADAFSRVIDKLNEM